MDKWYRDHFLAKDDVASGSVTREQMDIILAAYEQLLIAYPPNPVVFLPWPEPDIIEELKNG